MTDEVLPDPRGVKPLLGSRNLKGREKKTNIKHFPLSLKHQDALVSRIREFRE